MASSSTNINKYTHDVFLSFRGADTRDTFTGHLHQALLHKGIYVFIDNELDRGEEITPQLLKVIKESRISIVVLSKRYASSPFCLEELVKILECRESERQFVIPVFYHVDPTDVEEQTGAFGQEFAKLEAHWKFIPAKAVRFFSSMGHTLPVFGKSVEEQKEGATTVIDRVQSWRLALSMVATLSGYHLKQGDHEANTICDIVNKVSTRLHHVTTLHVGENLVGLDSRVNYIHEKLEIESDDNCMLGLHGMGGIGKTTLAKALYNKWAKQFEFDGCVFLENVRENSNKQGLAQLQEKLLREILRVQNLHLGNSDKGIEVIKHRLGCKKVLILIDDVDNIEQLQNLVGKKEWFGAGSKIIITTRDLSFLTFHGVTKVYEVKKLEHDEALALFSWHAFKEIQPREAYVELTHRATRYAQGLPLALVVLGSSLYKRSVRWWDETLKKLEQCGNDKINERIFNVLKVSYDSLDSEEKTIFLDIAFFLKGKEKDTIIKFLDGCGFFGFIGVEKLIEKSLLYDSDGKLWMHDLLEELGTRIATENSSRLCIRKGEDFPLGNTRTHDIEILVLDLHEEEELPLDWLQSLTNLRVLTIRNGRFIKMPKKLPNNIRWFEWHNSCLKSIPSGFFPPNLAVLEMPRSNTKTFLIELPKAQKFMNLTSMNLSGSEHLKEMVIDFSSTPNIEVLNLSWCEKLKKIHKSVGRLEQLKTLYLSECCSLTSLPNLAKNQRLLELDLSDCSKLENLPNLPTSLTNLHLTGAGIKEIPSFIGNLINLRYIRASSCKNLIRVSNSIYKFFLFPNFFIYLHNCPNLYQLPESESSMLSSNPPAKSFLHLGLIGNKFVSLPINSFKFIRIKSLILDDCESLVEIPELPRTLRLLEARKCKSLVRFSQFQFDNSFIGCFQECHKLLGENEKKSWREMVERKEVYPKWGYGIIVPGDEIPEWFSYAFNCYGFDHSFQLPSSLFNPNLIAFAYSAIFEPTSESFCEFKFSMNKYNIHHCYPNTRTESKHMWLGFQSTDFNFTLVKDEEISCQFVCYDKKAVLKRVGVHFIYNN